MDNYRCFCCALCSGLFEILANLGKALIIIMVNTMFSYLGYLLITCGGTAVAFLQLNYLTSTPIMGNPTNVSIPAAPLVFTAILS